MLKSLPTPPRSAPPTSNGFRVLLVEDNPINQKLGRRLVERLGGVVDVAGDGEEALHSLEKGEYDLVLMDCQMPVMDGYAAVAEIRRRSWAMSRIPVIAMTASALPGDRERCLQAGFDDYLAKPIRPEELDGVLQRWGHLGRNYLREEEATHGAIR